MSTSLLLTMTLLALAPQVGAGAASGSVAHGTPPHDLHVTYANAAVEGATLVVRIRIFKDDLEAALGRAAGADVLQLAPEPAVDAAFMAYLAPRFVVEVDGRALPARILARGEDELDREPVWWYTIHFTAAAPLTAFRLRNTLLLELFRDQRNVVKVVHFPDQRQLTFSFAAGEEVAEVRFQDR
ncbi:MAG: DUF6702 family protein [Gemmatimonadota bacterium]